MLGRASWCAIAVVAALGYALAVSAPVNAEDAANVWVRLASLPIAAGPGQAVTHTVTVGADAASASGRTEVFFASTARLENLTVTTTVGTCKITSDTAVRCTLTGATMLTPAAITVRGSVAPVAAGSVVHNIATVVSQPTDGNDGDNSSANAYIPIPDPASVAALPEQTPSPTVEALPTSPGHDSPQWPNTVLGAGVVAIGATAAFLMIRGRRRSGRERGLNTGHGRHRRPGLPRVPKLAIRARGAKAQ